MPEHPCIRVRVVDDMQPGDGDCGLSFSEGVTVMRLREGAMVTHRLGLEMQHLIHGAHQWVLERDRGERESGKHRKRSRLWPRRKPEPTPVSGPHTTPLPITPTDRHGRGYGPPARP